MPYRSASSSASRPYSEPDQRCGQASGTDDHIAVVVILHRQAQPDHAGLKDHSSFHALGAVAGGGVDNLVTENCRQLGFVLKLDQQAAVDRDLSARQCPRIGNGIVEDHKLIGQIGTIADRRQAGAHGLHIPGQFRKRILISALHLLHRGVVLLTQGHLLGL